MTTVSASQPVSLADHLAEKRGRTQRLNRRPRLLDRLVYTFLFLSGTLSILTTIGFTVVLGSEALNFFATIEWLNINKQLAGAVEADTTIFQLNTGGTNVVEGDLLRLTIEDRGEQVRVVRVLDATTVEVERGVNGTQAVAHPNGVPIFSGAEVTLREFFTGTRWAPQVGNFGVLPLMTATFMTSLIGMIVALPIGLGAAIYLSEYAAPRARAVIKPIIEVLAGVPTVVYGYFALTFVTPLLRSIFGTDVVQVYNMASAGLVIGILIIPTIASISEDALTAVPRSLRDASYGMGATRLETVVRVLLPAALSGIAAAVILGISRAVGETMIVLIAAGAGPNFSFNPFDNAETMAGHIARISTGDIARGTIDYNSVFAVGLTLFVATFLLNIASNIITRRFREVYA